MESTASEIKDLSFYLTFKGINPTVCNCMPSKFQMRIPLEHFTATPVFALSPTQQSNNAEKSGSRPSRSDNSASDAAAAAADVFAVARVSSDSHGGQVRRMTEYWKILRFSWVAVTSCFCCAVALAVCMQTGQLCKMQQNRKLALTQPSHSAFQHGRQTC